MTNKNIRIYVFWEFFQYIRDAVNTLWAWNLRDIYYRVL